MKMPLCSSGLPVSCWPPDWQNPIGSQGVRQSEKGGVLSEGATGKSEGGMEQDQAQLGTAHSFVSSASTHGSLPTNKCDKTTPEAL